MGEQQLSRLPDFNRDKRIFPLRDLAIAEGFKTAGETVAEISAAGQA